jgi:serine/threonine protein phosphatase PrpC
VSACPRCGELADDDDQYCEACGAPLAPPTDRTARGGPPEVDAGSAAGLTNPGLVKAENQDALFLRRTEHGLAAVICDGVSTSLGAATAAQVACTAAGKALSAHAGSDAPGRSMRSAIAAAQTAVLTVPWPAGAEFAAPACTIVAALWDGVRITVGSLGDSRAYWVGPRGTVALTSDDSWAREQVDAGLLSPEDAIGHWRAHQITRWLGADAPDTAPNLTVFAPDCPGRLVLCSDGLWNYAPADDELGAWVRAPGQGTPPVEVARSLVERAIALGGHDNITVAVADIEPATTGGDA